MRDFPLNQQNFDAVAQLAPLYNAANTNLHAYQQRGGKLILWHGLADDSVSPAFSIAYYRGVEAEMGHAATDTFLRLFLLPGVAHCGNGEGYDQIDLLTPLMRWTEEGIAPQEIMLQVTVSFILFRYHGRQTGNSRCRPAADDRKTRCANAVSRRAESQSALR